METLLKESVKLNKDNWKEISANLRNEFSKNAERHDTENSFVFDNYLMLKEVKAFSAGIPEELGGGGLSYKEMCFFLLEIAKGCSSTALALSMHEHLVAANIWKYKKGQPVEELLRKITQNQLILVSTGAGDWLASNGTMEKVEGGYRVTAQKHFASQSVIGNVLVTTSIYQDPIEGNKVLHFSVPFKTEGVSIKDDWMSLGMRGTGSNTVVLKDVFVPDTAIVMQRPQYDFHPFYNVVMGVAMPLIMSVYVGIAEKAWEIAVAHFKKEQDPYSIYTIGEMQKEYTNARLIWEDMIRVNNEYNFEAVPEIGNDILIRKSIVSNSCLNTLSKAMELIGGRSYLKFSEIERLHRDVQAVRFHPLQEKAQQFVSGNILLGNKVSMK